MIEAVSSLTPATWIAGVCIPIGAVILGAFVSSALMRASNREHDAATRIETAMGTMSSTLAKHSEALAVLVGQVTPMGDRLTHAESSIQHLRESTAVLARELELHKQYVQETKDELHARIAGGRRGD